MGIFRNSRVVNTGSIGDVQDAGDDDFGFGAGFHDDSAGNGHTGVINTGVMGNVQNGSGNGNSQQINYS